MKGITQSEFARQVGVAKSYVTKLKQQGRIVLFDDGSVDSDATRALIAETADPSRAPALAAVANPPPAPALVTEDDEEESDGLISYQEARAEKERFAAKMARLEYERAIGKLVDKAEVQLVVEDVITQFRQGLENLPYRLAPELVGQDLDGIRSALKHEIFDALGKMQRGFVRQMEDIGKDES